MAGLGWASARWALAGLAGSGLLVSVLATSRPAVAWEPTAREGAYAKPASSAVTDEANGSKTVVVAVRFGRGLVLRPGFPSFAQRLSANTDPATTALMARMWTLLSH